MSNIDIRNLWTPEQLAAASGQAFDRYLRLFLAGEAESRRDEWARVLRMVKSPIEAKLAAALFFLYPSDLGLDSDIHWWESDADIETYDCHTPQAFMCISPQHRVGAYTVDFAVGARFYGGDRFRFLIALECDGHDFHEKTKSQAAHDKKRDRFLTAEGYRVLRFTGSEIDREAACCAAEVISLLSAISAELAGA